MKLARIFAAASSGTNSQSTSPAETSYVFGSGWSTTTPRSESVSAIARTSSISGTLLNRQRSPVRVAAASIFSAAFLAPLTRIVPSSGAPPVTRNRSRGTVGGSYSQWNGLASAMRRQSTVGHRRLVMRQRSARRAGRASDAAATLAVAPLGEADAQERLWSWARATARSAPSW